MKDVVSIGLAHVATALRERVTLFWFLAFPVFMLVLLSLIFGGIGQEGAINFEVALIAERPANSNPTGFGAILAGVFEQLATPRAAGNEPLLTLHRPEPADDVERFLDRELAALRRGQRAAIVVIPADFDDAVRAALQEPAAAADPATVLVYMSRTSVASTMAAEMIEQILNDFDAGVLAESGRFDPSLSVATETVWIGPSDEGTPYVDYLLPGIVLMAFFTNGLFGVPGTILFNRDRRVLRRYWVTPLSVPRYLAGFSLGHLGLCILQFLLLFVLGRYALGATVSFARPGAVLILLLAAATFMAFGFLIASLVRTANAGMAAANILNMPMMFLSGMFFPVAGLPAFLQAVVYVNPVSYLVSGLRASVGVESASFAPALLVGVPLGWIALSLLIGARRLKWDVGR